MLHERLLNVKTTATALSPCNSRHKWCICRIIRNLLWFYPKPPVILPETSCGFTRNLLWFCLKPPVVLPETSCGFDLFRIV